MQKYTYYIIYIAFLSSTLNLSGQTFGDTQEKHDSIYNENIKKSKLYGIYIPKDLDDAYKRLLKLTPPQAIRKFKEGPELEVCKKLHFGIGRWMIVNWNFYEGSRLSHYLKGKGLLHPDDMAQFILRTFHKTLNKVEIEESKIIEELAVLRKKEADYLLNK